MRWETVVKLLRSVRVRLPWLLGRGYCPQWDPRRRILGELLQQFRVWPCLLRGEHRVGIRRHDPRFRFREDDQGRMHIDPLPPLVGRCSRCGAQVRSWS